MSIGKTRATKAEKTGPAIRLLDNGRWALVVDGLVRFTCYDQQECTDRARAAGYTLG